jgi:hypothetical protein
MRMNVAPKGNEVNPLNNKKTNAHGGWTIKIGRLYVISISYP